MNQQKIANFVAANKLTYLFMPSFRIGIAFIMLCLVSSSSFSQDYHLSRDVQVMKSRKHYIQQLHDSISSTDKQLVNGEIYVHHGQNARNHPYFLEEKWFKGTVITSGHIYTDLLLRYDISLDQPLLFHIADGANVIALNKEKISGFTIEQNKFIFLDPSNTEKSKLKPGYYQLVYEGEYNLLAKWKKHRKKNDGFRPDEFIESRNIILKKNNQYFPVKNDKALRNLLGQNKQEVRLFMQQRNIHLYNSSAEQLSLVLRYFETLNKVVE